MKKYINIISVILLIGCSKPVVEEVITPVATTQRDNRVTVLVQDTTVNGVWDGAGKVLRINDKVIRGKGTLQNWVIDAPLTQQIFDTSINLVNIQTYGDRFSTGWYGVKKTNSDNWWNIQKSINVCIQNHLACYTPNGTYKYSKTLQILSLAANNNFQICSLHFFGDASYWDNSLGTTFQYTGTTGPGLNMQLNKGTEVDHLVFSGLWKSPSGNDSTYFSLTEATYTDKSGYNLKDNYSGLTVDWSMPLDGVTRSGSTGIHLHDISIGGFANLLAMSQNGFTQNDDVMRVENLHLFDGKFGIVNGQAQEKDMKFSGVYSWGSIFCIVSIGKHGAFQAGDYSFDGANIAGRCIQVFDISAAHWYSTNINDWYCESITKIGTFSTQMPITITNSNFDLNTNVPKTRAVISSNSTYVAFHNCTIRYYDGLGSNVYVEGAMTIPNYPDNYFGGGNLLYK